MSDETFNADRFYEMAADWGHTSWLGIGYRGCGPDWLELSLPFRDDLVGDEERGVLASGVIFTLMDMAVGGAIWMRTGKFAPQATLDFRLDYIRPARPGATVIGHGECYRATRRIAFVRGVAHDGDPDDPVAHAAGTFIFTAVA